MRRAIGGSYLAGIKEIVCAREVFDFEQNPMRCLFIDGEYHFDMNHSFLDIYLHQLMIMGNPILLRGLRQTREKNEFRIQMDTVSIPGGLVNTHQDVGTCLFISRDWLEDCFPVGWIFWKGGLPGDRIDFDYEFKTP